MSDGGGYAEARPPALSAPAEAARLRALGFNVIPVKPRSKMPRAGEGDVMRWRKEMCSEEILENDNIAMLHGGVGCTWALDCDDHTILEDLLDDYESIAPRLCVVRTPKQGHHIIFRKNELDAPPGDPKFTDRHGRNIDVKSLGYTLLPPSVHPERNLGRYTYLFKTDAPNLGINWSDVEHVLRGHGFFSPQDREEMMSDVTKSFAAGGGGGAYVPGASPKYDYNDLLQGGFGPGERRRKMNSLYVKKRVMGSTVESAEEAVRHVNSTCQPPLPERELKYNIQASEHFFQAHKDEIDNRWQQRQQQYQQGRAPAGGGGAVPAATGAPQGGGGRRGRNALDMHQCADTIMHETKYKGHPSGALYYYTGGIWVQGGEHRLRQSCEFRWRDRKITPTQIREIEDIVRIRTAIVPDGTGEDVFDRDASKIVLVNGTYDLELDKLVEHSPDHMATIRHPITHDATAECPVFDEAMDGWFGSDDQKYHSIVLEMFALCMLRKNIIQKGYVHYGKGSNGKSTCLKVLREMLGPQNTASIEMQAFEDNRFVGDDLFGKSANISSDGGTQPLVKTGRIKAVLGGDSITCEPKYKKSFVFQPFITLVFTFNELPPVLDSSDGFARKIQLVPWQNKFDRKDNPEIARLPHDQAERAGLFNRMVPIMRRFLLDNGQPAHEDDIQTTQNLWMRRSDSFFLFKSEYLVLGKDYKIETGKLGMLYAKACAEHGMTPLPKNEFFNRMSELLGGKKPTPTKINGENVRVWKGATERSELRPEGQKPLGGQGTSS